MDEYSIFWMVVIALGTIIGLFLTVGNPIIKLNSTLTELNTRMGNIESNVNSFTEKNRESHKRIHERIDVVEDDVKDLKLDVERIKDGHFCVKK